MERWDAYDMEFHKAAGVTLVRGGEIPEGLFHLVCGVLVEHADGTYLVMRRALSKSFGGLWEATAGGSALAGETPLDCALRELREETGPFDGGGPGAQRECPRHFRGVSLPDRRGKGDGFLTAGGGQIIHLIKAVFSRRRKRRQPKNMAYIISDLSVRK